MIGKMRTTLGIPERAMLAACLAFVLGCGGERDAAPETIDSVQLNLAFSGGATLDSVAYVLTGPNGRHVGTFPVLDQPTVSATFNNLPAGSYDVTVQGTATDGVNICKGEAMFTVAMQMNVVVPVALTCSGTAAVSADVNVCPTINSLSVAPSEVYVGSSMNLVLAAVDPDNGPSPLTAAWSSTSGTLSNLSSTGATFTCTVAGMFKVGVSVSDGTPQTKCADTASVDVVCTAPPGGM
jgi:hypothetical protein